MVHFFEVLLRPPGSLIWLAIVGLLLLRTRWRRAGVVALVSAVALLYLSSIPLTVVALTRPLDRYPEIDPLSKVPQAQAIVILSAGTRASAREYGRDVVSPMGLDRLHYGAWLHRRFDLPILVTGHTGDVMARAMEEWFGTEVRWIESGSRNTHQHAVHCAALLREAGITKIYLVTHFWHMPRAMAAFEQIDIEIVPAPMGFGDSDADWYDPRWLLPSSGPLCTTSLLLHEWIGRVWYRVRYGY